MPYVSGTMWYCEFRLKWPLFSSISPLPFQSRFEVPLHFDTKTYGSKVPNNAILYELFNHDGFLLWISPATKPPGPPPPAGQAYGTSLRFWVLNKKPGVLNAKYTSFLIQNSSFLSIISELRFIIFCQASFAEGLPEATGPKLDGAIDGAKLH